MTTSSKTFNETTLPPQPSMTNNLLQSYMICIVSRSSSIIYLMFVIINISIHLPLSAFILHHGLQQWKKRSTCSSTGPTNHSDCFTYHLASIELIGVTGCVFILCFICKAHLSGLLEAGVLLFSCTWFGEMFFHILTCLEHYLAVVHPIMYMKLRNARWIRIRNAIVGLIWLLCFLGTVLLKFSFFTITLYCILSVSVPVVSFCTLSVLRVLVRRGPGEQSGCRERADQAKQRAFLTILAILGVLVFRYAWSIFWAVLQVSGGSADCISMTIDVWFNLPSSLVLPILFVIRTGKHVCCEKNIQGV